jgi:chromosome segregation ATPase
MAATDQFVEMRAELAAAIATAETTVSTAGATLEAATTEQRTAQDLLNGLMAHFRSLEGNLHAQGKSMAPFLAKKRSDSERRLQAAKKARTEAEAALRAAEAALDQLRLAKSQLAEMRV